MSKDAYKSTLCLPQTKFPMKADLPKREPLTLAFWEENRVYPRLLEQTRGRPVYCHHDGPPYANGHIHYGTILNKVLKDIVVKHHAMAGFHTKYLPGWDCHGLPIELAVERESGKRSQDRDPLEVRRDCRAFAEKFIDIQRGEFRRLGGFGLWEDPYLTMKPRYEAAIVRGVAAFATAAPSTAVAGQSTGAPPVARPWPRPRSSTATSSRRRSTWRSPALIPTSSWPRPD